MREVDGQARHNQLVKRVGFLIKLEQELVDGKLTLLDLGRQGRDIIKSICVELAVLVEAAVLEEARDTRPRWPDSLDKDLGVVLSLLECSRAGALLQVGDSVIPNVVNVAFAGHGRQSTVALGGAVPVALHLAPHILVECD